ncbi:oxygen-regulated protein 1-like [Clinocottus analis]|uniref:oxygen-regulated protein 1-like n=1 Tax=Clinocottus analis TaxID=304258 RepID=UPI0035BFB2CE
MNDTGFRRVLPEQSFGSGHTFGTPRHPSLIDPILSKRVCFYKSGDPQFNGLRMVINNRTFKTFDALLDSLSKKVPLPFGVRNISTPRGIHAVHTLDDLEDGKSYICSDSRKVKPINLALARKKPPPWYHARPVSSRRRTVQQARLFPGRNIHKQESTLVRTPKTLLVFRNGDPTVEHSVMLHKRTTPTFESILEYMSELMQFNVVKLYTADGRRVDGLPGLILCSGTVVAVGREPFRHANYNVQKSPAETTLPTKRLGHRRLKSLKLKKKSQPHTPKSRNFSLSSERYIVNRIQNSISGHMLESVPETPETPDTCLGVGAEAQDSFLPTEDDIEKSFRVNQDGSMTVEMRVRLTIKEEETIHWTTTLARSSVANQLNLTCLPKPVAEGEISSLKSNPQDLESPAASIDKDKTQDNDDEDPPSLGDGVFSQCNNEEDDSKVQTNMESPRRAPTPGHKRMQASVESLKSVTVEGIQEGVVGTYAYREQTEDGAVTEQYCMVKQKSSRPVPKPRRHGSVEANNINGRNVPPFKSAGMTEIRQIESSGEKVSETVLHVYEQQTCQDSFFANLCSERMSAFGIPFGRPATSETGQLSSNNEFEPPPWRPSTASEAISIWRSESASVTSDLTLPSRTGVIQAINAQSRFPKPTNGKAKPQQPREVNKDKRVSSKHKVINKRVRRIKSPGKRRKENSAGATEKSQKVKTFSSAGFIKGIYGHKSKSAKSMRKLKKGQTQNGDRGVTTGSSQQSDDTIRCILKDSNTPPALKETTSETVSSEEGSLNVAPNEVSQPRGILTRQTSMHQEKKKEKESYDVSESMSLPAFNSCSAVTNEYVENWLEKARLNPSAHPNQEGKEIDVLSPVQTENGRCVESENKKGLMIVADEATSLEDTFGGALTLKVGPLPQDDLRASVKQRIRSFENKSPSQSMEKATVNQQVLHSHETTTNTENDDNSAHNNTDKIKPLSEIIPPINMTSTESPPGSEMENNSSQIKILFQKEMPPKSFSMELPPPPPPVENTDVPNTDSSMTGAASVASLDMASQPVRHKSSEKPLSGNLSSDNASEQTNKTQSKTSSQRRRHQTPQSINSTDELEKTLPLAPLDAERSDDSKMTNDLEKSITQIIPQPLNIVNQPKMKPELEKICYPIESIRQITQNKRPSCLEKSNSLPDFSSHVALTFGSSSKVLLAFLSIMTLKEGLAGINMDELKADNVTGAEALKMIDSLRRIASIKDSHELNVSLSNLQQSASKQLLQSWKDFQDLSDKCKSRSSTPNISEQEVVSEAGSEKDCGVVEYVIDEIVDNLDIPKRLKEELISLSKVRSDSEEQREKVGPKDNTKVSNFSTDDAVNVRDVAKDEKLNIDVSSIIKTFTDVIQPKQCSTGRITKDPKDKDSLYEQMGADKCPPAEPTPEEQELYSTVFFEKDNRDNSNPEKTKRKGSVSSKESLEQDGSTSEVEEPDVEGYQLQMHSEESVLDNELFCDEESVSDEEGQHTSSATKDLEQKMLCKLSVSSSEAGEQRSSEEELEVECEATQQETRGGGHLSNAESPSQEEEDEQPEVEHQAARMGSNVSVDESTCDSDADDPSSEEEQPEVECKKLKVIIEETLSDNEKEEEEYLPPLPDPTEPTRKYGVLKTLIEETEEDKLSSEEEVHRTDEAYISDTVGGDPSRFIERKDSYTKKDKSSLIKSDRLTKTYGFNADEDSGNDHSSCEEHVEIEQPTVEDKPINNSSCDNKEFSSEEEHADVDRYTEESCPGYQEAPAKSKDTKCEKVVAKLKHQTGQSVAERVILLEKQVADAHKPTEGSVIRRFSQRNAPLEPAVEDSPSKSPTSQPAAAARSAPQSSLSFSYDSSGVITSEPEGNKVRSIREMFLAKSATEIQPRCFPSSNTSETRTETSASGGYQSQTSCELSSSEDDSARKSITKGFVRRTIERLYGKKDANPDEEASERPPSAPKQKKKEHLSLFSPFHISKAMSELSYFNSTNTVDTLSEATRCVAFNAQIGPEDRVSLDNEQWFLRENAPIRKSVSDPVGINKNSSNTQGEEMCEDTAESTPYSHFSSKSEQEDRSLRSKKCTYFSLPHMSDSDAYQDDLSAVSKSSAGGDSPIDTKEESEDTRTWAERNGTLPGVGVTGFKLKDNKVHPLTEPPPDGEVVVVQPGKGQGVMSRRVQEPDMLDILYNFCGQNCPIL